MNMNASTPLTPTDGSGYELINKSNQQGLTVSNAEGKNVRIGFQKDGFGEGKDYGIITAQDGFDVETAEPDEQIISSQFNSFKIVESGVITVPEVEVDSDVGENITQDYATTYDSSYTSPIVLAYIDRETVLQNIIGQTASSDPAIGTEAWSTTGSPGAGSVIYADTATGLTYPTATGDTFNDFTNPANVYASDGSYATITAFDNGVAHYQDYYAFGFSVPANTRATSIEMSIESHYTTSDPVAPNLTVQVYDEAGNWVNVGSVLTPNLTTDTTQTGSVGAWTYTLLTSTVINDDVYATGIKFRLKVDCGSVGAGYSATVYIDDFQVNVLTSTTLITDNSVKLVLPGGTLGSTDKADGQVIQETTDRYSYGGSGDLWGEALTPAIVNDTDFGIVVSWVSDTTETEYLKLDNLGYAIPLTAEITGVLVSVNGYIDLGSGGTTAFIQNVVISVYYGDSGSVQDWSAVIMTTQDPAGSGTIQIETYQKRSIIANSGNLTFRVNAVVPLLSAGLYIFGSWDVRYYILVETAGT